MTPASILASIPADVLRAGDNLNQRQRQSIRLARYFEQRGHRPTWAEIEAERARRNPNPHREVNRHRGSSTTKGTS